MSRLRKIFGSLFAIICSLWGAAKCVVDSTGRTTFVDDATQLGEKLNTVSAWLLEQPSLLFYSAMVALGLIGIFLIIAPALPIRKFFENRGLITPDKKKLAPLGFVMRPHPPFVDNIIITPDDRVVSYHMRYVGVRNLDNEKTINNVRVQAIGGDQASSAIPMLLLDKYGKSFFSLSPNEVHLFVFTRQAIKQDGGYGRVHIPGENNSSVPIVPKGEQIVRLGAYGDDVSATVEFVFSFNQKGRLQIRPLKLGDYPETNEARVHAQFLFGKQRPITTPSALPPDAP